MYGDIGDNIDVFNPANATGKRAGIAMRTSSGWHIKLATEQDRYWLALYDAFWNLKHAWIDVNYWLAGDTSTITFGSARDVNLYRAGADLLKTDDDLEARSLRVGGATVVDGSRRLMNLASVAQSLLPDSDGTFDLGSPTLRWRDVYAMVVKGALISLD
jgi:hypothetical protein